MSNSSDLMGDKLRDIALKLADDANAQSTSKDIRLEIFKHLTTYYVNTTKINRKPDKSDDEGETFDDWKHSTQSSGSTDTATNGTKARN